VEVQLIWFDVQARLHHAALGRRPFVSIYHIFSFYSFFFVAATGRLFCQISATNLSATPCSVWGVVTESGTASILRVSSYSVKEGVTEDVTRDVMGSRGDFDWVALQKLVNVNGVWTPVTVSSLS